jgi:hypothetical protein
LKLLRYFRHHDVDIGRGTFEHFDVEPHQLQLSSGDGHFLASDPECRVGFVNLLATEDFSLHQFRLRQLQVGSSVGSRRDQSLQAFDDGSATGQSSLIQIADSHCLFFRELNINLGPPPFEEGLQSLGIIELPLIRAVGADGPQTGGHGSGNAQHGRRYLAQTNSVRVELGGEGTFPINPDPFLVHNLDGTSQHPVGLRHLAVIRMVLGHEQQIQQHQSGNGQGTEELDQKRNPSTETCGCLLFGGQDLGARGRGIGW